MNGRYVLDGKRAVPVADVAEWAKRLEAGNRRVAEDTIQEPVRVSTVFLGLDHNHGFDGPPQLFEKMILGGSHDQYMERCATWEEAEEMHRRAVALASS